jgi:hypothetical protein
MPGPAVLANWQYFRFGIVVTGRGEELFLAELFRSLTVRGNCRFEVIARILQLRPITSPKRFLQMTGTGKQLTNRDEELGLVARRYLASHANAFVILVDDLEYDWREQIRPVYDRYRTALTAMTGKQSSRTSVHFFVYMLEAYYFADTTAVNAVLDTTLTDHNGDVEEIRHPKQDLKVCALHFDEIDHGREIVRRLNLPQVLSSPRTCRALRSLVGWCCRAMALPFTDEFQLLHGEFHAVTSPQLDELPLSP